MLARLLGDGFSLVGFSAGLILGFTLLTTPMNNLTDTLKKKA